MKGKNNWKRIKHDRKKPLGEFISITNQGLTLGAKFGDLPKYKKALVPNKKIVSIGGSDD